MQIVVVAGQSVHAGKVIVGGIIYILQLDIIRLGVDISDALGLYRHIREPHLAGCVVKAKHQPHSALVGCHRKVERHQRPVVGACHAEAVLFGAPIFRGIIRRPLHHTEADSLIAGRRILLNHILGLHPRIQRIVACRQLVSADHIDVGRFVGSGII